MISKSFTLIGFQSCGKTTLGRLLAKQLQCSFIDTDQLIEQFHAPLSCREIVQKFGMAYFRELESHVVKSLSIGVFSKLALTEKVNNFCAFLSSNFNNQMEFRKQSMDSAIILAIGGGTLNQADNGQLLKNKTCFIYLRTSPEILKARIWQRQTLPAYLNALDPHQSLIQIYQERTALYNQWADYIVDMDNLEIEQALEKLLAILIM